MDKSMSLFDLNNKIKQAINSSFPSKQWIVAEISELRINQNGHCYLELIEKNEKTNKVVAKARATIWAYNFSMLNSYFKSETNQELTAGLKVMVYADVVFQEVYSYSINIVDINPNYTLGDIAKKRKETIARLENEGVFYMNKNLDISSIPKNIALISSPTAAGYDDFIKQINGNTQGFSFLVKLFPAVMQGDNAEQSILQALDRIFEYEELFDAVVIIRGGGSQADLNCFDSYWLAYNITQFPLPVICGIGHNRDQSVLDLVANMSLKTPTAVANYFIDLLSSQEKHILTMESYFISAVQGILQESKQKINVLSHRFIPTVNACLEKKNSRLSIANSKLRSVSQSFCEKREVNLQVQITKLKLHTEAKISARKFNISNLQSKLKHSVDSILKNNKYKLNIWGQAMHYADPLQMLKKGYSISTFNGKILKNNDLLKENDIIETHLSGAVLTSRILKIKKNG